MLVVLSFAGVAFAAATGPLFAEAAGNAALARVLSSVPLDAPSAQAAEVRLIGATGRDVPVQDWVTQLEQTPGMSPPVRFARSSGPDLAPRSARPEGVLSGNGKVVAARLVGIDDPAAKLVVAGEAEPSSGLWVPQPLAVRVGLSQTHKGIMTSEGKEQAIMVAGTSRRESLPRRTTSRMMDPGSGTPADGIVQDRPRSSRRGWRSH